MTENFSDTYFSRDDCAKIGFIREDIEKNYINKNIIDSYHNRYHKHPNLEIIINGYEEVMVSKYRLPNNTLLKDRFNNDYKIIIRDDLMYIYNYKLRNLTTNYYDMGINWIRINKELD